MEPLEKKDCIGPIFINEQHYNKYFSHLICVELGHERQVKEKLHTNLCVSWENLKDKVLKIYLNFTKFDELVVNIGDTVIVYCEDKLAEEQLGYKWSITGRVASLPSLQGGTLNIGFKNKFVRRSKMCSITYSSADLNIIKNHTKNYSFRVELNSTNYKRVATMMSFLINPNSDRYIGPHIKYAILKGEINTENKINCLPQSIDSYLDDIELKLNSSQLDAVKSVLQDKFTLIQGPPGTGKTTTSAAIVKIFTKLKEQIYPGKYEYKILVTSPSNSSADHLARTINQLYDLNVLRFCSFIKESEMSTANHLTLHAIVQKKLDADKSFKFYMEEKKNRKLTATEKNSICNIRRVYELETLKNSPIICCTCTTAGDLKLKNFKFPFVIVDECTQAIEPHSMIPICMGSDYVVLIGDHRQLGPTVLSDLAAESGLKRSLFDRLLSLGIKMNTLKVQYRMHPVLAQFPSMEFYENKIESGVTILERTPAGDFWLDRKRPIVFHQCSNPEVISTIGKSYTNPLQCHIVLYYLTKLLAAGVDSDEIGIMTPYKGQKNYIRDTVKNHPLIDDSDFLKLEINTIDSFQGREKDYIIFSTVRCNLLGSIGFLSQHRRLNVAITRARRGLIIIGDMNTLKSDPVYSRYLQFLVEKNLTIYSF